MQIIDRVTPTNFLAVDNHYIRPYKRITDVFRFVDGIVSCLLDSACPIEHVLGFDGVFALAYTQCIMLGFKRLTNFVAEGIDRVAETTVHGLQTIIDDEFSVEYIQIDFGGVL